MLRRIAAAICIALVPGAIAAPKAKGPTECDYFWDAAIVARGFAIAGATPAQLEQAMAQIYGEINAQPPSENEQRIAEILGAIGRAAVVSSSKRASEFAAKLSNTCYERRGDMNSVLGVAL